MRIVNATKEHLDMVLEIEKKSFTMPWSRFASEIASVGHTVRHLSHLMHVARKCASS